MEAARVQPRGQLEHLALGAPGIEAGDEQANGDPARPHAGHLSKAGALRPEAVSLSACVDRVLEIRVHHDVVVPDFQGVAVDSVPMASHRRSKAKLATGSCSLPAGTRPRMGARQSDTPAQRRRSHTTRMWSSSCKPRPGAQRVAEDIEVRRTLEWWNREGRRRRGRHNRRRNSSRC